MLRKGRVTSSSSVTWTKGWRAISQFADDAELGGVADTPHTGRSGTESCAAFRQTWTG